MTKQERKVCLIAAMAFWAIIAITCWIAGIMGHVHQLFWAVVATLICVCLYAEYKSIKKS